jgi:uncharacterized protein YeaO (DUF488 family)
MIRTKSVYSPIDREKDGLRVLVTRFRGRGMPITRYHVWMANLGPSEQLLRGNQTWQDFRRKYRAELMEDETIDKRNRTIKNHGQKFTLRLLQKLGRSGNLTLLCHCPEDEPHCHRHLLRQLLLSKI